VAAVSLPLRRLFGIGRDFVLRGFLFGWTTGNGFPLRLCAEPDASRSARSVSFTLYTDLISSVFRVRTESKDNLFALISRLSVYLKTN
jgi:hypothetical protein